jgi:hypothetical protein
VFELPALRAQNPDSPEGGIIMRAYRTAHLPITLLLADQLPAQNLPPNSRRGALRAGLVR